MLPTLAYESLKATCKDLGLPVEVREKAVFGCSMSGTPRRRSAATRRKVDLIYIDPPFMVNSDFRVDNTIDIESDEEEGVQAKKEPSLVEHLACRDTWRLRT